MERKSQVLKSRMWPFWGGYEAVFTVSHRNSHMSIWDVGAMASNIENGDSLMSANRVLAEGRCRHAIEYYAAVKKHETDDMVYF